MAVVVSPVLKAIIVIAAGKLCVEQVTMQRQAIQAVKNVQRVMFSQIQDKVHVPSAVASI